VLLGENEPRDDAESYPWSGQEAVHDRRFGSCARLVRRPRHLCGLFVVAANVGLSERLCLDPYPAWGIFVAVHPFEGYAHLFWYPISKGCRGVADSPGT
jgi:hypothetical protein